jgi:hypothetical protein
MGWSAGFKRFGEAERLAVQTFRPAAATISMSAVHLIANGERGSVFRYRRTVGIARLRSGETLAADLIAGDRLQRSGTSGFKLFGDDVGPVLAQSGDDQELRVKPRTAQRSLWFIMPQLWSVASPSISAADKGLQVCYPDLRPFGCRRNARLANAHPAAAFVIDQDIALGTGENSAMGHSFRREAR